MKEETFFSEKELTAARQYWLAQLSGDREELDLQHGFKIVPERKKENYRVIFPPHLREKIFDICKDQDLLLYILLVTVFKLLLSKYTGQNEILIGSPIYSASGEYYEYNTCIPLLDRLNVEMSFRQLLGQVKNTIIEGYKNQHYSIEEVLADLGVNNIGSRSFNYMKLILLMENIHKKEIIRDNMDSPANEITVSFIKVGHSLEAHIFYNSLLFNEARITELFASYLQVFEQVLLYRDVRLADILWITEAERRQLLFEFNDTAAEYPQSCTVVDLFTAQVEKTPHHPALVFKDYQFSYKALNERVNRVALWLAQQGVNTDSFVGMMAIYSVEMIIGLLGILKAGGAYLPIDPGYPAKRINYMLRDAGVKILLAKVLPNMLTGIDFNGEILDLENPRLYKPAQTGAENPGKNTASHLVYVIYTSGSTGEPKGVLVEHRSVVNYASWKIREYGFTPADKTLQLISLCFDGFGANLYPPLLSGGALVIPDGSRYGDFKYINRVIDEKNITHMSVVPIMYRACLENVEKDECFKSLRIVVLAGEKTAAELIELSISRYPHITLINEYGPTEGTIAVTAHRGVTPAEAGIIGKPAANMNIYILDKTMQLQPIGVPGELCISGVGLARGYLNQPELTTRKFDRDIKTGEKQKTNKKFLRGGGNQWVSGSVGQLDDRQAQLGNPLIMVPRPHPETNENQHHRFAQHIGTPRRGAPGRRRQNLYKSGDRARWLADGNIELLGRMDQQVKIRGYRVELREVEAALDQIGVIKQAVVLDKRDTMGNNYLCAYFTANKTINTAELREMLMAVLPEYMVPSRFIRLEKFPLTLNGKLDRKALPEPEQVVETGLEFVEPVNQVEKDLVGVWQRVLKIERVGTKDNFFDLGGNSFLLMQVNTETEKLYPGCLSITDFFAHPTIARLAALINKKQGGAGMWAGIELKTVRLPGDYFHPEGLRGVSDSPGELGFQLTGDTLKNMKNISRQEGIEIPHILLAGYIYLFGRLSGTPLVVCQGMCREKGRIIPLEVDLAGVRDFPGFFQSVKRLQEDKVHGSYDVEDLGRIKLKKPVNEVVPFFYRKELLGGAGDLTRIFDIVLEVEEQDMRVSLVCRFNNRLSEEKIEALIHQYVSLIDFILAQCLESGVQEVENLK